MDSSARGKLEAWLHYADDLGLGPFYLDRAAPQAAPPESSGAPSFAERRVGTVQELSRDNPIPSTNAGAASSGSQRAGASAFVPAAPAPSLFESSDRIENDTLDRVRADIGPNCTRCKLHKARTNIVFGVGNPKAQLVFVGEGPGRDEDEQGEPFVGRAGKLLTQMIEAMGLRRQDVYI